MAACNIQRGGHVSGRAIDLQRICRKDLMPLQSVGDEKIDRWVGAILQAGVVASGALVLLGGVLYLIPNAQLVANYRVFGNESAEIRSLRPILSGVVRFDGRALIELGILALVATPVIRVMFSVFAFAVQRDRLY